MLILSRFTTAIRQISNFDTKGIKKTEPGISNLPDSVLAGPDGQDIHSAISDMQRNPNKIDFVASFLSDNFTMSVRVTASIAILRHYLTYSDLPVEKRVLIEGISKEIYGVKISAKKEREFVAMFICFNLRHERLGQVIDFIANGDIILQTQAITVLGQMKEDPRYKKATDSIINRLIAHDYDLDSTGLSGSAKHLIACFYTNEDK